MSVKQLPCKNQGLAHKIEELALCACHWRTKIQPCDDNSNSI